MYIQEVRCKFLSHVWLFGTPWTLHLQSMEFSRPEHWSESPSTGDRPNPGIKPRSPGLQEDSFPAERQRKPKNMGVGSLSFLQQIFPTQGLNWGLLHWRWILYQLSYQGSPWCAYICTCTHTCVYTYVCMYTNVVSTQIIGLCSVDMYPFAVFFLCILFKKHFHRKAWVSYKLFCIVLESVLG